MNTLSNRSAFLKEDKSHVLFVNKDVDFGIPVRQRKEILTLWKRGRGINSISKSVKRNPHEVFLTLYEYWMERKIDDIERAFKEPSTLLVPGREQLRRG